MKRLSVRLMTLICIMLICLSLSLPVLAADGGEGASALNQFASEILAINSLEDANAFLDDYSLGVLLITALIATLMAFCGYRALRFAILLGGFSAGWIAGATIYNWIAVAGLLDNLAPIPQFVPYLIYAICGCLAAFLAMRVIRIGIFLAAAAATYFFLNSFPIVNEWIDRLISEDIEIKYLIVKLLLAAIVGFLAIAITRPVLIITTGAAGGMIAAVALMVAAGQTANVNLELVIGITLAIIGVIVQFSTGRKKRRVRR